MKIILTAAASLLLVLALAPLGHALEVGDHAPDFTVPSTDGDLRLSDFEGRKHVVLAFYFKDFSPG